MTAVGKKRKFPFLNLADMVKDRSTHVYEDDLCVAILDKFPKATVHYLILPVEQINTIRDLKAEHIPLLKHMIDVGVKLTESHVDLEFRYGFHAVPSMSWLHMHVISQDFISDMLKTKKHWNSFTSEFFIDASKLLIMLEESGAINIDRTKYESYLKKNLMCHKCGCQIRNMPLLKEHLLMHRDKKENFTEHL